MDITHRGGRRERRQRHDRRGRTRWSAGGWRWWPPWVRGGAAEQEGRPGAREGGSPTAAARRHWQVERSKFCDDVNHTRTGTASSHTSMHRHMSECVAFFCTLSLRTGAHIDVCTRTVTLYTLWEHYKLTASGRRSCAAADGGAPRGPRPAADQGGWQGSARGPPGHLRGGGTGTV